MNKELGDNEFHERLQMFLPRENCVIHNWSEPEDFLSTLGLMDFHIGNRLHSVIMADILGVPNIGINSDPPKIKSYISKTSLLPQERVIDFMQEISMERIEEISKNYERPVSFIQQESLQAQQCLDRIFGSGS